MRCHLFFLAAVLWCAGCGLAKYEQRLDQTAEYFEYQNMLNASLASPAWTGSVLFDGKSVPVGMSMRIPKMPQAFTKMPGPQPILDENENLVAYTEETRQPSRLGIQLPGIVEAWEMERPSGNVRLYVLGNYDLLLQQAAEAGAVDPTLYFEQLEYALQQGLQVGFVKETGSPADDNRIYTASFPATERFQLVKNFNVYNIAPPQPIEGIEWRAQLYEVYEGDTGPVRVAILCIFPAAELSTIVGPLELALETLSVSDQAPKKPDDTGASGGSF